MKLLLKISLCFILGACSFGNGRYAALSDRPITLYTLTTANRWTVATNIESTSSKHTWLFLAVEDTPTLEQAVGYALDEHMGDYMNNVSVRYTGFNFIGLYNYTCWRVEGDVIRVFQ